MANNYSLSPNGTLNIVQTDNDHDNSKKGYSIFEFIDDFTHIIASLFVILLIVIFSPHEVVFGDGKLYAGPSEEYTYSVDFGGNDKISLETPEDLATKVGHWIVTIKDRDIASYVLQLTENGSRIGKIMYEDGSCLALFSDKTDVDTLRNNENLVAAFLAKNIPVQIFQKNNLYYAIWIQDECGWCLVEDSNFYSLIQIKDTIVGLVRTINSQIDY